MMSTSLLPPRRGRYAARAVLGAATSLSFVGVQRAVSDKLGRGAGLCFAVLLCSQFHLLYYASRFLPNTFALIASNLSLAALVRDSGRADSRSAVLWLTCATAIFRCDLVLLLAPVCLVLLAARRTTILTLLSQGVAFTVVSVAATVTVDSAIWGRWLWPELEVFLFNNPAGENQSSQWGMSPPMWYFTNCLPMCLTGTLPLSLVGFWHERRTRNLLPIALGFLVAYSFLPHKEKRFVFPSLPYFAVLGASGLDRLVLKKKPTARSAAAALVAVSAVALSFGAALVLARCSQANYPGGEAFLRLHEMATAEEREQPIRVHIGVLPAMTGVSRFGEEHGRWVYNKEPLAETAGGEAGGEMAAAVFDYVLTDRPSLREFDQVFAAEGFAGLGVPRSLEEATQAVLATGIPVRVVRKPQVYVHRRKR